MITTGTSHFVSVRAANSYYEPYGLDSADVLHKITNGEIHIGPPTLKPGERLVVIDNDTGHSWGGRYAIRGTA